MNVIKTLFAAPEDYNQMLRKIATATGLTAFACVWILSKADHGVEAMMYGPQARVSVLGVSVPLLPAAIAVLVAFTSRAVKLHDRISDLFGIRKRFDLREIIGPMAGDSGLNWNDERRARAELARDRLMRRIFYRYASSTNPVIDKHLIVSALDKWSWFWIAIEAEVLLAVTSIFLISWRRYDIALWVAAGMLLVGIVARLIEIGCRSNAEAQVDEILRDPGRKAEIVAELNALLG